MDRWKDRQASVLGVNIFNYKVWRPMGAYFSSCRGLVAFSHLEGPSGRLDPTPSPW